MNDLRIYGRVTFEGWGRPDTWVRNQEFAASFQQEQG